MRGLNTKAGFGPDTERTVVQCNYGKLPGYLPAPHSEKVGLVKLYQQEPGIDSTCAFKKGAVVDTSEPPEKVGLKSAPVENNTREDFFSELLLVFFT